MSRRRKKFSWRRGDRGESSSSDGPQKGATAAPSGSEAGGSEVATSGWSEADAQPAARDFPQPGPIDEPMRIALSAEASAEVVAHAKESLDAEVCGVLVGELCEDDQGQWVFAKAAIRGSSTRRGGAHVTYTQETWQKIHEAKDRDYPKLRIVGWYHTHPGFGVTFSEMDRFIQRNFFAARGQFALVLDPLSGDEAICVNGPAGIEQVSRFWVGGRPRNCRVTAGRSEGDPADRSEEGSAVARRLKSVEERLQQVLLSIDEERTMRHQLRMALGLLLAVGIITWISFNVLGYAFPRQEPPEGITWQQKPVMIDGKPALLGVKVVRWELPASMHAAYVEAIEEQLLARQEAEARAAEQQGKSQQQGKPQQKGASEQKGASGQKGKPQPGAAPDKTPAAPKQQPKASPQPGPAPPADTPPPKKE